MRVKIQVGDSEVDVGAKLQEGLKELDRIRRDQVKGLKRFRSRHAPTEEKVIAGLNRVTELLGYRFVLVKGKAVAAAPAPGRSAKRVLRSRATAKHR